MGAFRLSTSSGGTLLIMTSRGDVCSSAMHHSYDQQRPVSCV